MISPTFATVILIVFLCLFGILLPILGAHKSFSKAISFRWMCIVVILAIMIGCVLDFAELDNECRHLLLLGGLIIVGGYVALRTLEKLFAKGYIGKKPVHLKLAKGDISAEAEFGCDTDEQK